MTRNQIGAILAAVVLAAAAPILTLFLLHTLDGISPAYAQGPADVKILSQQILAEDCVSPPPTQIPVGQDVVICVEKILHNNGPLGPAPTSIDKGIDPIDPCTVDPLYHSDQVVLEVSVSAFHYEYFTINCPVPGVGGLYITNHIDVKPPWVDPEFGNNDAWDELIVEALPVVDLEKVDLYVKPFYCGDTDMDGDEATGIQVMVGLGTCCDGIDNDANTVTDGQDPKCWPHINEDPLDGSYDDGDSYDGEDPPSYPAGGQTCPWNGDDDCDSVVDEDPKNGIDDDGDYVVAPYGPCVLGYGPEYGCDEDPADGFLGIDNDRDEAVDEDGAGRYDFNGDTVIDWIQYEGFDDDGDTSVDEDPLDSPVYVFELTNVHEAHYLIKEILFNNGPTSPVIAEDITEVDAPSWRVNLKEDGLTTCTDNLDNDGDGWADAFDPECLNPHIGEEDGNVHACNDGLDNGDGWGIGDDLIDEADSDDCGTQTEVSVECESADDIITVKAGVPWYLKPRSDDPRLLDPEYGCEEYYDDVHLNSCVPCRIPMGVGPFEGACGENYEGQCVVVDSVPGVYKELDFHKWVELVNQPTVMTVIGDWPPGDPTGTLWQDVMGPTWQLAAWTDNGDGVLSWGDEIAMLDVATAQVRLFHVDWIDPPGMGLTENGILTEHQYDLACFEDPSLHKFTIQNAIHPTEGFIDPNYANNFGETEMLVACTAYTDAVMVDMSGPSSPWDVQVSSAQIQPVTVTAMNGESTVQDFIVSLKAESPGLGIGGPNGMTDTDGDGWADNLEAALSSDPDNDLSMPESLHAGDTCSDGVNNDGFWFTDAADIKCVDTDGDGFADIEEWIFGRGLNEHLDANKTPEHMQFPWTCDDDVDNDGDGSCDDDGCSAYPGVAESDSADTDTENDCDIHQLGEVRPPVICASGWQSHPGATYDVKLAGNGDLSVTINIPAPSIAPAEVRPVTGELVLHCFAPAAPYPTQTVWGIIRTANPHVLDLFTDFWFPRMFDGNATCADTADLEIEDWLFDPAPSPILPINEWEGWSTDKVIYNGGPNDAAQVRVRKTMNVPEDCQGYMRVAYAGETIEIAEWTEWQINDTGWNAAAPGTTTLVEPTDVSIGDYVYVKGSASLPELTNELLARFDLPDPIIQYTYGHAYEDLGIMCEQEGEYPFVLGNQVTHADYPTTCDPNLANISMDLVVQARARTCNAEHSDADGFTDDVECYLDTDPWDGCTDLPGDVDAWPLDVDMSTDISVTGDVFNYVGRVGATPGSPNWWKRLDIDMSGDISVTGDVFQYVGRIGEVCT